MSENCQSTILSGSSGKILAKIIGKLSVEKAR
jgi:hypothetical protein